MTQKSLRHVIAITSQSAFLEIGQLPSILRVIAAIREYEPRANLIITGSAEHLALIPKSVQAELRACNTNDPHSLVAALSDLIEENQVIAIYDASRPHTNVDVIGKTFQALAQDVDAVRPAIAFTETLKFVDENFIIQETLDRTSVKRVASPEIIRSKAIDPSAKDSGWFLPLKANVVISYVEGSADGVRISSAEDVLLLESVSE